MKNKILSITLLLFVSISFQSFAQESTDVLLANAQKLAKEQGKSILVKFEASWCGWCHRMTKNMKAESTKKFFDDNFIIVPIVVFEAKGKKDLENPGGEDLIKKYNNGKSRVGLPFWFFLDTNLNLIEDSYNSKKQNLGCPASPEEVKEFIAKLKGIVPDFSDTDEENITKQFILKKK